MMLHANNVTGMADPGLARHSKRKAAAETPEGNERLSKRLSLLNLGKSQPQSQSQSQTRRTTTGRGADHPDNAGARAYLPAAGSLDHPQPTPAAYAPAPPAPSALPAVIEDLGETQHNAPPVPVVIPEVLPRLHPKSGKTILSSGGGDDDDMQMDNTKYKVFIHSIDDELAEDEAAADADGEATYDTVQTTDDTGKLVFLPVIDKHLRAAARDAALGASLALAQPAALPHPKLAVPRPIVPNKDGELAGMQVVLYRDPSSLSVPPENDSVRQAILDTRARFRERRREEEERDSSRLRGPVEVVDVTDIDDDDDTSMASTPVPGTPIAAAADAGIESDVMDLD